MKTTGLAVSDRELRDLLVTDLEIISQDEFERACRCFAGAVRPGGTLVGAFLNRSDHYAVADYEFPGAQATRESVLAAFDGMIADVAIEMIGIVEEEIRVGYSGTILLTATRA